MQILQGTSANQSTPILESASDRERILLVDMPLHGSGTRQGPGTAQRREAEEKKMVVGKATKKNGINYRILGRPSINIHF